MNYESLVIGTLSQDAFVMVNKKLAKRLGFTEAGLLAELIFTHNSVKKDNKFFDSGEKGPWFYLTQATVEERLGIKRREHETAIKNLKKEEIIFVKKMGLPSKNYYMINWKKIVDILEGNEPEPAPQSVCTKRTNKDGRNVQTRMDDSYKQGWTKRTSIHIKKKDLEKRLIKRTYKKIVNKEAVNKKSITNMANEFYNEFAVTRWSKEQWLNLIDKIADEMLKSEKAITNHAAYVHAVLKNVAYKHDLKYGKIESPVNLVNSSIPFYNWLEDEGEEK